jgi:hypothetical protein
MGLSLFSPSQANVLLHVTGNWLLVVLIEKYRYPKTRRLSPIKLMKAMKAERLHKWEHW